VALGDDRCTFPSTRPFVKVVAWATVENIEVARRFLETYAVGDPEGFVACLTGDWLMHEADGGRSTVADRAEITTKSSWAPRARSLRLSPYVTRT
jgi:hypothetical protein